MPQWRIKSPLGAVVQKDRIIACTPCAYRQGVRPGMRRNTAAGRVAGMQFVSDDPHCRQKRLEEIALSLLQYTPQLALFNANALVLDVGASLRLFKGPRALCQGIRGTLASAHVQARIGMAPTALGAWLLARQAQKSRRRVVRLHTLTQALASLPVRYLPAAAPYLEWLTSIACTTLQQLASLPRASLIQRTSPQLGQDLDAAYGKKPLRFNWYQAPETFHAIHALGFHTANASALLTVAALLIEQLCGWLQARQFAAGTLEFLFHYEKGRHARPPSRISVRLSTPGWQASTFLSLLSEQIQQQQLDAPVIAIELRKVEGQPRQKQSDSLFPDPAQYPRQENQLIDLLCARLGPQHVLQPLPIAHHLPEHSNQWVPMHYSPPGNSAPTPAPTSLLANSRPFWLLDQAVALTTQNDRPVYQNRVLHLNQGPERLESGWWMNAGHEQRDYFVATDNKQRRYWIYRQRGSAHPLWFLQGFFA